MTALWLDDIAPHERGTVGGKAFTLARLKQAGLPVPNGFVVAASDAIRGGAPLVTAYERLGGSVAVRSSALAEDLAEASFAGQYRTLLDVRGSDAVERAAAECAASIREAVGYADAVGAAADGAMAVLVQSFVEPRLAGVVFTRDPRNTLHVLIEAHAGRGEELVAGRVRPERQVVRRSDGVLVDGAAGRLDAGTRGALLDLCARVEALLGAPQDIEWALGDNGLVLLQARPITVEHEAQTHPAARRLTRANVGEVLPDPVTPLTWTSVCSYLEHGFVEVTGRAGLLPAAAGPFLVLHRSRIYLNLSLVVGLSAGLPGISADDAERLILGVGGADGGGPGFRWSGLPRYAVVVLRLLGLARWLPGAVSAAERRVQVLPAQATTDRLSASELAATLDDLLLVGQEVGTAHIATSGAAAFRLALLTRFVEGLGLATPGDVVNRLVGGLDGVASVSPTLVLEQLAAEARSRPEWRTALDQDPATTCAALRARRLPAELQARLDSFLERFGHRGISEAELRTAAWEQDPTPVCAALRALLDAPRPPGLGHAARTAARSADTQSLRARLPPIRRLLLTKVLASTQHWVTERERTKSLAVALVHRFRCTVQVAARQLVNLGVLRQIDDVFFLTLPELVATLRGQERPAFALIARRRRRLEREGALPAPRFVDLDAPEDAAALAHTRLTGIGVSPGVGVGPARVVTDTASATLEPGEILVAPVLDAALGPLLASAAGAVAEIGGLLSHGSVVVRELGVPCVVDVPDVTRRIRNGQRLLVDGSAGLVRLLDDEVDQPAERQERSGLRPVDPEQERVHELGDHPRARESVYFNVQDPAGELALVASLGRRPGGRGEALIALQHAHGPLLFGLSLERAQISERAFSVGGFCTGWAPVHLRVKARLRPFDAARFPHGPLRILARARSVEVDLDLRFTPRTPAVDFCDGLDASAMQALEPLGSHHIEQSGTWEGELAIGALRLHVNGTGSRDQSWGRRDWSAADYWRLFTLRLGDDVAVHALCVSVRGRRIEGGFVWQGGRLTPVTRVEHTAEYGPGGLRAFDLVVSTADGRPLALRGQVVRRLSVPVELQRRPLRHLFGRPWALVLHEHFTRYEGLGRTGFGMAEFTERR